MTNFEEVCKELGIEIKTDENGMYVEETKLLALISNEVILSDDESTRNLPWNEQKKIIKNKYQKENS